MTAKLATTLDHLSDGRAVLGLGGGWFEREHDAFGIDFGSGFGERLDRLDESARLIRRLLDGETVNHDGRFYSMHDAICAPRPDPGPTADPHRWLRAHQDAAHDRGSRGPVERLWAAGPDREVSEVLRQRCDEIGRPFDEIERTVTIHGIVRDSPDDAREVWADQARRHGLEGVAGSDGSDRGLSIGGSPAEVAAFLEGYRRIGIGEVIFVFRAPFDVETIERLGEVREALGG